MITIKMNGATVTCKPENLQNYRLAMEKASKIRKPGKPKAEKRRFPNDSASLASTAAYVEAYLRINNGYGRNNPPLLGPIVDGADGYIANTAPTTWPEGDDVIAWEESEC